MTAPQTAKLEKHHWQILIGLPLANLALMFGAHVLADALKYGRTPHGAWGALEIAALMALFAIGAGLSVRGMTETLRRKQQHPPQV